MGATGALAPARPKRQRRTRGDMFFGAKRARGAANGGGEKAWTRGFRSATATPIRVQAKTNGHGFGAGLETTPSLFGDAPGSPSDGLKATSVTCTMDLQKSAFEWSQLTHPLPDERVNPSADRRGCAHCEEADRTAIGDLVRGWQRRGHEPSRSRAPRPLRTAVNQEAARGAGRRRFINGPGRTLQSPRPPQRA